MKKMKFIIAPDSFKESLDAFEAAAAIKAGLLRIFPEAEYALNPLADGGEGTARVLVEAGGGSFREVVVTGPCHRPVTARYGFLGPEKKAVIEIASACGLAMVPEAERDPLLTTTFGVGELILSALDAGVREFIVGLGGSGTNDGGLGMLQALGLQAYDGSGAGLGLGGEVLSRVVRIDRSGLDPRLASCSFEVICDVENPLTGPLGATYTFGPQKGADSASREELERGMVNYARILRENTGVDIGGIKGAGAAGGLGAAFLLLGARLLPGSGVVLRHTGFEDKLKGADFIFSGEGSVDRQTAFGKTISAVAASAKAHGVPLIVLTGMAGDGLEALYELGVTAVFSIADRPKTLAEALEEAEDCLSKASENVGRLIRFRME